MMPEGPLKGSKVKVTVRRNANKKFAKLWITQPGISIKFTTDYDQVPPDLPQTFKVNRSEVKVIVWHDILA